MFVASSRLQNIYLPVFLSAVKFLRFFKLKKHVNKINQVETDNYEKRLAYSTTTRDAK